MGEKTISQQNCQGIAPLCVNCGLLTSYIGAIHNVVMHQGRQMNQLHDDGEVDVTRANGSSRSAGQKRKCRPQSLATAAASVGNVAFNRRIECSCLFTNSFLNSIEVRINQLDGVPELYCAQVAQSRFCEDFHEPTLVRFFFMVNQSRTSLGKVLDLSHRILGRQQKQQNRGRFCPDPRNYLDTYKPCGC